MNKDIQIVNEVKLRGEIVNEPLFKHSESVQRQKLSFLLKAGIPNDPEHWAIVPVTFWDSKANELRDILQKGSIISLTGSLGTWKPKTLEGKKFRRWAVNATEARVLTRKA